VSAVRAAHRPTLPELLGARRWRVVRAVALVVAAILAVVALLSGAGETLIVQRGRVDFNFAYEPPLHKVGPATVEERRGATFVQSMSVSAFPLPAYRGDPGGTLPIVADRLAQRLAAERPGFRLADEGKARINDSPGYVIAWEGRIGTRRVFARDFLLVPGDEAAPRVAARIELMSTYAGGVAKADDVGSIGGLKRALRSFRFGTERP
jgi:hypothetical protein